MSDGAWGAFGRKKGSVYLSETKLTQPCTECNVNVNFYPGNRIFLDERYNFIYELSKVGVRFLNRKCRRHPCFQPFHHQVDFFFGIEVTETETDRHMIRIGMNGFEYMRIF